MDGKCRWCGNDNNVKLVEQKYCFDCIQVGLVSPCAECGKFFPCKTHFMAKNNGVCTGCACKDSLKRRRLRSVGVPLEGDYNKKKSNMNQQEIVFGTAALPPAAAAAAAESTDDEEEQHPGKEAFSECGADSASSGGEEEDGSDAVAGNLVPAPSVFPPTSSNRANSGKFSKKQPIMSPQDKILTQIIHNSALYDAQGAEQERKPKSLNANAAAKNTDKKQQQQLNSGSKGKRAKSPSISDSPAKRRSRTKREEDIKTEKFNCLVKAYYEFVKTNKNGVQFNLPLNLN